MYFGVRYISAFFVIHPSRVLIVVLNCFKTRAEGNCAFHALLGEWDEFEEEFACPDIPTKRSEVSDAVLGVIDSREEKSRLKELITAGIQDLAIGKT